MSFLQEIQDVVARTAESVGPSVVALGRGWGRGCGVIVAEGRVLTNAHNLRGDEVTVTFADGRREAGRVAAVDIDADLAVIEVETGGAPMVAWGDGPSLGAPVLALGNPGGRRLRVSFGLVSATGGSFRGPRGRRVGTTLEHTAPLVRGSSGGPVVDAEGRLVGINTLRLDGSLIVALAADAAMKERVEALGRGESPNRTRLGVAVAPPRAARRMRRAVGLPDRDGVLVREVVAEGPAARAGLEEGDLIVAVGGEAVGRLDDLFHALDAAGERGTLDLTVVRGVEERTISLSLNGV
jgi:serine protease Do